ncbi:MAG TPA: pirin-like C-terminal cupin domain-containing protein, partial [Candidatus Acidoferrales bacterium]|nr:pirin-like C-terminal cupin domain-containing protein [Candidatus Acidoferrales bacterium]
GPVRDVVTRPEYLDVSLPPAGAFTHRTPRGHTVFAYVIGGKGIFCQQKDPYSYETEGDGYFDMERAPLVGDGHLLLFGDGDTVSVTTEAEPVRFLLISGKPIGEPIAWQGPIVMNTQEELRVAFEELEHGTFIKSQNVAR